MERAFVDEVRMEVRGTDGGNGCVSFHREKYRARGERRLVDVIPA